MGRRNFLIDGVSGSGKTSVATELERRGYQVVHGDRELKYRGDPVTGDPVPVPASFADEHARAVWVSSHLCWPVERVRALIEDDTEAVTFFCGGSRNAHQFLHLFDGVFVLDVDLDTMNARLDQRPDDEWAGRGRAAERELAVRLHRTRENLPPGVLVDATRPLAVVVDEILASASAATPGATREAPAWRSRRRGIFEGLPRLAFRRSGSRYIGVCAAGTVLHGMAVAAFGFVLLVLYVDMSAGDLALYALASLGGYVVEGVVAARHVQRLAAPVRSWLTGADGEDAARHAWSAAAGLPVALLRCRDLYLLGAVGAAAADLLLAGLLGLPALDALMLLPLSCLLYLSSVVLRFLGLELGMRPVLEAVGEQLPPPTQRAQVSLHLRLVAAVPTVTWATGVIVTGLLTDNTGSLDRIGLASVTALGVAAAVSVWLSLVLADAVSGPIVDLRDATRRVAAGDLTVRVPVVSTDESGQLAESFNVMVAGLDERERLRDALGVLVDPALTERLLAEGTDLHGEDVDTTILFLDVRDFTAFAETAAPRDVVAALNTLYDLVVPVILRHGGHANRFLGDGLLAVFGAPQRHPDHAVRAVRAAHEIIGVLRQRSGDELRVGMGLNTGRVVAGTIGGGGRRDFTVIGDAVNTAARVEALTRDGDDDILITEATWEALPADLQQEYDERPGVRLKGKSTAVRLYARRVPARLTPGRATS